MKHKKDFNYTANAHPELRSNEITITYNINNFDFGQLVNDESIYFPRIVKLKINQFKHQ
ncbi:MAG: hypothetical protein IPF54_13360 [Draconibacterium sp.]|nr:hypothetical protein [Draconibacterium sp.]